MRLYFLGHVLLIAATAPWIFVAAGQGGEVAGLPLWALYTVGASTAYALFVAVSYAKLWEKNAEVEGDE